MSMINQMLKDLDSRQVRTGESQAMLTDVRLSSRQNRKLIKPLGLAVLAFSIGFGLFARFRQTQSVDPIIDNTAVASTVVADPVQPAPMVTELPTATKTCDEPTATYDYETKLVTCLHDLPRRLPKRLNPKSQSK